MNLRYIILIIIASFCINNIAQESCLGGLVECADGTTYRYACNKSFLDGLFYPPIIKDNELKICPECPLKLFNEQEIAKFICKKYSISPNVETLEPCNPAKCEEVKTLGEIEGWQIGYNVDPEDWFPKQDII